MRRTWHYWIFVWLGLCSSEILPGWQLKRMSLLCVFVRVRVRAWAQIPAVSQFPFFFSGKVTSGCWSADGQRLTVGIGSILLVSTLRIHKQREKETRIIQCHGISHHVGVMDSGPVTPLHKQNTRFTHVFRWFKTRGQATQCKFVRSPERDGFKWWIHAIR